MLNLKSFLVFSLVIQLSSALHYPQYFLAYPYKSCIGISDHYWLDTNTKIADEVQEIYYKSIIVQGLWRVNFDDKQIFMEVSLNENNPCTVVAPDDAGNYFALKSVEKLAAGDLDDSFLTLYPSSMFEGDPIIISDQGQTYVDFTMGSWALTGGQAFTIFDGEYFTGSSTCILPDDDAKGVKGGISIRQRMEQRLIVRSVKLGCDLKTRRVIRGNTEKYNFAQDSNGIQVNSRFIRYEKFPKIIESY